MVDNDTLEKQLAADIKKFIPSFDIQSLRKHKAALGVGDFSTLTDYEKVTFIDNLVPRVTPQKMSFTKVAFLRHALIKHMNIDPAFLSLWKVSKDHIPSPKDYLLTKEMESEFTEFMNKKIREKFMKPKNPLAKPETRQKRAKSILGDAFGLLSKKAFDTLGGDDLAADKTDYIANKQLALYMKPAKARKIASGVLKASELGDSKGDGAELDQERMSKKLVNYINDDNFLHARIMRNRYGVSDFVEMPDNMKAAILKNLSERYFGHMGGKYLDHTHNKVLFSQSVLKDDKQKLLLNYAMIKDGVGSLLLNEHVEKALDAIRERYNIEVD